MFERCCGQPLGKLEYWGKRDSVGEFGGSGMGLLVVGCGRILVQWQNPRQGAGGDSELVLCTGCILETGGWKARAQQGCGPCKIAV